MDGKIVSVGLDLLRGRYRKWEDESENRYKKVIEPNVTYVSACDLIVRGVDQQLRLNTGDYCAGMVLMEYPDRRLEAQFHRYQHPH